MSRRRRKKSPFSLFSFQDIITSVTAVIILITLILALELITRKPSSAAAQYNQSATELRTALEEADQERRELENRLQREASDSAEVAAVTPQSLQRDQEQTQEQIERLRREVEQLKQRRKVANEQEDAVLARSFERDGDREAVDDFEAKALAADSQRQDIQQDGRLIYNAPPGTTKRPWLVDVSANSIVVLPIGPHGDRSEFDSRFLNSCTAQMLAWVRHECNPTTDYFVLLVRPSGTDNLRLLREELRDRGYEIGIDLIGSTQKVTTTSSRTQ